MDRRNWSTENVENSKLDGLPPFGFDCGREEQNAFLYERAWPNQQDALSTTYLFHLDGVFAAYVAVVMDSLPLNRAERGPIPYSRVGALKVGQLGVDLRYQGRGVGRFVVSFALDLARAVGERVACRYLNLDAQPDLVGWYARLGFVTNRVRQAERVEDAIRHGRDPNGIAVSMRLDLREE